MDNYNINYLAHHGRRLILPILIYAMVIGCSGTKFILFGIDVDQLQDRDAAIVMLGAAASIAAHVAGHYAAAEIVGADLYQDGPCEKTNGDASDLQRRWIAMGGFFAQTGMNTILTTVNRRSNFTRGFTIGTAFSTLSYYRHPDSGDFHYYEKSGGDADREHAIITGITAYNIGRISIH